MVNKSASQTETSEFQTNFLAAALVAAPFAVGIPLGMGGVKGSRYEQTHTSTVQNGVKFQLKNSASVVSEADGNTYTFDFTANTVRVKKAFEATKGGLDMIVNVTLAQRRATDTTPFSDNDPAAIQAARNAGCAIAGHLETLSGQGSPLFGVTHSRLQERGRAFKADFC